MNSSSSTPKASTGASSSAPGRCSPSAGSSDRDISRDRAEIFAERAAECENEFGEGGWGGSPPDTQTLPNRARRVDVLVFECCHLWTRAKLRARGAFASLGRAADASSAAARDIGDAAADDSEASALGSLAAASDRLGYSLHLLGGRNALRLSSVGYAARDFARFERWCARPQSEGGFDFCNFALVLDSPELRPMTRMVNMDDGMCHHP